MQNLGPTPDPGNQNLHFNTIHFKVFEGLSHIITLILYPLFSLAGILGSNNWPFPHLPHPLPVGDLS